ncbi:hypothetical protein ACUSMK_003194 [Escherichia albertii]
MVTNPKIPLTGLYVSKVNPSNRIVVTDIHIVQDDDDEPGDLPFYLVTFVNEGDEDDMLAPSWELAPDEWEQLVDEECFMRVEQPSK